MYLSGKKYVNSNKVRLKSVEDLNVKCGLYKIHFLITYCLNRISLQQRMHLHFSAIILSKNIKHTRIRFEFRLAIFFLCNRIVKSV